MKAALLLLLCVLGLSGCLSRPMEPVAFTHTTSKAQAAKLVDEWVKEDPANRTWSTAGYTGSMKPLLYGGEYLLLVRYKPGMPVPAGKLVVFDRWIGRADYTNVMHRVVCSSDKTGSFMAMGDNCSRPDGFLSKNRISFICEGIISFPQ